MTPGVLPRLQYVFLHEQTFIFLTRMVEVNSLSVGLSFVYGDCLWRCSLWSLDMKYMSTKHRNSLAAVTPNARSQRQQQPMTYSADASAARLTLECFDGRPGYTAVE